MLVDEVASSGFGEDLSTAFASLISLEMTGWGSLVLTPLEMTGVCARDDRGLFRFVLVGQNVFEESEVGAQKTVREVS